MALGRRSTAGFALALIIAPLLIQGVSADCYVLYPYYNVDGNPVFHCEDGLPEGFADSYWDATYKGYSMNEYRFFQMSNCRCKGHPVGGEHKVTDVYEFDEVCSFDVVYWPWHETYVGLPLYYEGCPDCPSKEYLWSYYSKVRPQDENLKKDALTIAKEYFAEKGKEYSEEVMGTQGTSCSKSKGPALVRSFPDEEPDIVGKTTCTYSPCLPLISCGELCRDKYNREGSCMDPENPAENYVALRGSSKYCAVEGELCHCRNEKPKVDVISLFVDPGYIKERSFVKDSFGYMFESDKIRPHDRLVCSASVSKEGLLDGEESKKEEKIAADLYLIIDNSEVRIKEGIACPYDEHMGFYNCEEEFVLKNVLGDSEGRVVACKMAPKDRFEKGVGGTSNGLRVVKHAFYTVPVNMDSTRVIGESNVEEQYRFFTDRSIVDDDHESWGKLVLMRGQKGLPGSYGGAGLYTELKSRVRRKLKSEFDSKTDRIVGIADVPGDDAGGCDRRRSEIIAIDIHSQKTMLAHELGHSFANYCDEYNARVWFIDNKGSRCPNDYPECCKDTSSLKYACTTPELGLWSCRGMPYAEDKSKRTDTALPVGPYWSIMGNQKTSVSRYKDVAFPETYDAFIYPLPRPSILKEGGFG